MTLLLTTLRPLPFPSLSSNSVQFPSNAIAALPSPPVPSSSTTKKRHASPVTDDNSVNDTTEKGNSSTFKRARMTLPPVDTPETHSTLTTTPMAK
jgi:hypothetical protein